MRRDYHYYAIYTIGLMAGLDAHIAQVLAYASEQVDDAKLSGPLELLRGGQYWPLSSAHPLVHPDFFQPKTALALYAPFHFFPGLDGESFEQRMVCRPDSQGLSALKHNVLNALDAPYGLHYLGISLHILADAYAHQGFSAIRSSQNKVNHLKIHSSGFLDLVLPSAGSVFPPIAHLQATTCPDEPACVWSYKDGDGTPVIAHNISRYLEASESIHAWLSHDIRRARPDWFVRPADNFSSLRKPLSQMFSLNMMLEDRINSWIRAYDYTLFGQWPLIPYHPKDWQKQAIAKETPSNSKTVKYLLKEEFEKSHWHLFNIALAQHMNYCRYELFPTYQIYI